MVHHYYRVVSNVLLTGMNENVRLRTLALLLIGRFFVLNGGGPMTGRRRGRGWRPFPATSGLTAQQSDCGNDSVIIITIIYHNSRPHTRRSSNFVIILIILYKYRCVVGVHTHIIKVYLGCLHHSINITCFNFHVSETVCDVSQYAHSEPSNCTCVVIYSISCKYRSQTFKLLFLTAPFKTIRIIISNRSGMYCCPYGCCEFYVGYCVKRVEL